MNTETDTDAGTAQWDVIVVGGASAGLSAALQLGRIRYRTLVLDHGAPRNRVAGHMHGYLGRDHTSPLDLTADGRRELARYGVEVRSVEAELVTGAIDDFTVRTSDGRELRARRVLLASGAADALPEVPGLAQYWGSGVHHCPFCDGWEYADQRIAVLLDVPEAIHQVKLLRRLSDDVTVLTNGLEVLDPEQVALMEALGVEIDPTPLTSVQRDGDDDGGEVSPLDLEFADGRTRRVDALFVRPTPTPRDSAVTAYDLERQDVFGIACIAADEMGRTSVPGLHAAGNVVNPMLSVAAAVGAGATAGYALAGELL
ncbi:NAD(P)/FAD-dependent oxidoreductase [Nocardioides gilvus]|uniref:NAD(P)/FAD-dependent oxidoreductase n=1 Tax=Nocardioides gilvus TaxID=1735589 RepID=UPI000D74220F|nr:NAD(P)/FAD-dependent oxidoreductase [Nocardioides gilvus]